MATTSPVELSLEELGLTSGAWTGLSDGLRRHLVRFVLRWLPPGSRGSETLALLPGPDAGPRDAYDRCRILLAAGRVEAARDLARELVNRPGAGNWGHRAVGEVFLALEKPHRADERFRAGADPLGRARAWLLLGDPARALDLLQEVDGDEPGALLVQQEALRRLGQPPGAVGDWESLFQEELTDLREMLGELPGDPASPSPDRPPQNTEELRRVLERHFGYDQFRPGQAEVILSLLQGRSVLGLLPTGAGKSLCFQIPALLSPGLTLVLSPLIALMKDQIEGLPPTLYRRATVIHSGLESGEAARRQQAVARGEISLVYTAPERLRQPQFVRALRDRGVSLLVVDEAHCVSLWGHDFRPDYLFIRRVREDLGSPAVLALTATAPPTMQDDIERQLGTPLVRVNLGTYRPNLRFSVLRVQSEVARRNRIITLLSEETGPTIVYVDRRKKAEELSRQLRDAGVPAVGYHAGLDRARRNAVQDEFMQNRARVIVATIAFGMGVDNPDVRLVLHASLPRSLEAYYQEAGRAGRDGLIARCILVHTGFDLELLRRHAEEDRLRRNELLRLYDLLADQLEQGLGGVTLEELVTPTGMDLTRLRVAIGALEQMGILERGYDVPFSVWVGVPALTGEGPGRGRQTPALTQALTQLGVPPGQAGIVPAAPLAGALQTPVDRLEEVLRELSVAGRIRFRVQKRFPGLRLLGARQEVGRRLNALLATQEDQDEHRIQGLIRYLDQPGCRQATISDYFGRPLEQACRRCDRCEETRVVADRSRRGYPVDAGPDRRGLELGGREQVVFERLQGWRNQKARAEGIPVQAVLPNRCLGAIARREPRTLPALAEISGMGRVRVRQYGEEILNLLRLT